MLGSPTDVVGWCLVPLMLPLHLIEEVAKPMSLALRLFGNIMGEDILLAVMAVLGIGIVSIFGCAGMVTGHSFTISVFLFISIIRYYSGISVFTFVLYIYSFSFTA